MSNINDLISIIIPIYNREAFIEECINSVFSQTYQNFEIILIDDGSTDGTLKICEKLTEKDSRIKLFKQEHGGVSNARNVGLDAAQGEFIFFLDSDDVIHPMLLQALVATLKNTDAGMAGTEDIYVNKDNWHLVAEICKQEPSRNYAYLNFEESIDTVMCGTHPFSPIGGVMMRRDLIGDTRFNPEFFMGEDFLFCYENLIKGASTVFLGAKLYYLRLHENNSSWNWNYSGYLNRFKRREWVWKSEESFGRVKNANVNKQAILGVFKMCAEKNKPYSEECKKMRKHLKESKKVLFPAFTFTDKTKYYLACYFPIIFSICIKVYSSIKRKNRTL